MAAQMASGCINHPSIEAVGRCKQCGKPFCGTCQIMGPTGKFCSEQCKTNHETFVQRAQQLDSMQRKSSFFANTGDLIKKILVFAAAAIIVLVVLHFIGVEIPVVSNIIYNITG